MELFTQRAGEGERGVVVVVQRKRTKRKKALPFSEDKRTKPYRNYNADILGFQRVMESEKLKLN